MPLTDEVHFYNELRFSPSGDRIAVGVGAGREDIWILDVRGAPPITLTSKAANHNPLWTPEGERVVFASTSSGEMALVWMPADGSVFEPEVLLTSEAIEGATPRPFFWTPDGRELVFSSRVVSAVAVFGQCHAKRNGRVPS